MADLLVCVGNTIIPEGYRDATDAEILSAAAEVVERRGAGVACDIMADSLRSLTKSVQWIEDNDVEPAGIFLSWDGDVIKALLPGDGT